VLVGGGSVAERFFALSNCKRVVGLSLAHPPNATISLLLSCLNNVVNHGTSHRSFNHRHASWWLCMYHVSVLIVGARYGLFGAWYWMWPVSLWLGGVVGGVVQSDGQAGELAQLRAELNEIKRLAGLVATTVSCRLDVDDIARRVPLIQETYAIRKV
jgi:hypothetical protein